PDPPGPGRARHARAARDTAEPGGRPPRMAARARPQPLRERRRPPADRAADLPQQPLPDVLHRHVRMGHGLPLRAHVHDRALPARRLPVLLGGHRARPQAAAAHLPGEGAAVLRLDHLPHHLRPHAHDGHRGHRRRLVQRARPALGGGPPRGPAGGRRHRLGLRRDPEPDHHRRAHRAMVAVRGARRPQARPDGAARHRDREARGRPARGLQRLPRRPRPGTALGAAVAAWLLGAAAAILLALACWALLAPAARRLPPGLARDLAAFLPDCVTTAGRLKGHPAVPRRAKAAVIAAGLYLASPIDLVPDFLPVIGPLDDVLVAALAFRYAAR